ncbi:Unknown protein sequence [Pseudomonas syringae pv. maculicola]|nr:Unknown protein sequence [Pseudomonas syringae pv. maculicola]
MEIGRTALPHVNSMLQYEFMVGQLQVQANVYHGSISAGAHHVVS